MAEPETPPPKSPIARPSALLFLYRALCLRCPECGESPIFSPLSKTHSLDDWMHPLPGCPRCGYAYAREPGYFLFSTWMIQFSVVGGTVLSVLTFLDFYREVPPLAIVLLAIPLIPILNFLFVRHSKALFLAMDHYFDPHVKPGVDPGSR